MTNPILDQCKMNPKSKKICANVHQLIFPLSYIKYTCLYSKEHYIIVQISLKKDDFKSFRCCFLSSWISMGLVLGKVNAMYLLIPT